MCLEEVIRNHFEVYRAGRNSDLSRRSVLQRMGIGVATAALLPAARLYADDVSPAMKQLSEYMSAAHTRELPEEVMEKTCLLYTSPSPRDGLLSRMPSSA